MNEFDKKRKAAWIGFGLICTVTLTVLILMPGVPIGAYLVLACMLLGYGTLLYGRRLKAKSAALEKKRTTTKRKRRRRLLEQDKGKVIAFPHTGHDTQRDTNEK